MSYQSSHRPATNLKLLLGVLATVLLSASMICEPARAQGNSAMPTSQGYPDEVKNYLRQLMVNAFMTNLREARINDRVLEVFRATAERRLATIPIESLVELQFISQLPLQSNGQEIHGNLSIMFNVGEISTWLSAVCGEVMPRISATDQTRVRPFCLPYSQLAPPTQP